MHESCTIQKHDECAYHVQAKDGFQFLCVNGRFSKIWSQLLSLAKDTSNITTQPLTQLLTMDDFDGYKEDDEQLLMSHKFVFLCYIEVRGSLL